MGTPMIHTLTFDEGRSFAEWERIIEYGKCMQSPYAENGLWFVTLRGIHLEKSWTGPRADHTFLVNERYARPHIMDEWKRDTTKWSEHAHKTIVGSWCHKYECLWKDVPVFEHTLPDGTRVKYGYCRTQTDEYPERELWYISFPERPTFIVDDLCLRPDFIERMGSDTLKWQIICWCRLEDEVDWEELKTGYRGSPAVVRTHSSIALDSPHLPFSVGEIEARVSKYEEALPRIKRKFKIEDWDSLGDYRKGKYLHSWQRSSGEDVLHLNSR